MPFTLPSYSAFVELVYATDTDAAVRVKLLEEAAPILYGGVSAMKDEGKRKKDEQECGNIHPSSFILHPSLEESLADRFERWRYQLLNNRRGRPSTTDQELIDVLDLAANALLQGRPRPPRSPRSILHATRQEQDAVAACFDPSVSLDQVTHRALEATTRTLSPCHPVTLSPCHPVTLSPCHLVTLSPCLVQVGKVTAGAG